MARKFYRTLPRISFLWHGEWSDPQLRYKKHLFNYWDVEDAFYDMFMDEHTTQEKELNTKILFANEQESFNHWLRENKERCYCMLDDWINFS